MVALLWFLLAAVLLAVAGLGLDLDGLLPAVLAALTLSLLTAALPWLALPLQLGLFTGFSLVLLLLLQRWSRRRRTRAIPPGGSSDRAVVISGFSAAEGLGRVRWQGQSWAALNLEPSRPLPAGAGVLVMGRDGTRLQVLADGQAAVPGWVAEVSAPEASAPEPSDRV